MTLNEREDEAITTFGQPQAHQHELGGDVMGTCLSTADARRCDSISELSTDLSAFDIRLRFILHRLPRSKPWQRRLRCELQVAERHTEALRISMLMNRPALENWKSAFAVHGSCLNASASLAGSRADATTAAVAQLLHGMSKSLLERFEQAMTFQRDTTYAPPRAASEPAIFPCSRSLDQQNGQ